jgi:hypothetical protein
MLFQNWPFGWLLDQNQPTAMLDALRRDDTDQVGALPARETQKPKKKKLEQEE